MQQLRNLINGWGKCYKSMRVAQTYLDLDAFIKQEVEIYLKALGIQLLGRNKRKQLKLFGIPSLFNMVEHSQKVTKTD